MLTWKTKLYVVDDSGGSSTSFKTYDKYDLKKIIANLRCEERKHHLVARKISPVSTHILNEIINEFFNTPNYKNDRLEKISIKAK